MQARRSVSGHAGAALWLRRVLDQVSGAPGGVSGNRRDKLCKAGTLMPYIKREGRQLLDSGRRLPDTAGELNYIFTRAIFAYVSQKQLSYQTINDVIGALEGAKLEFYRRVVSPYEDKKIKENGDVYLMASDRDSVCDVPSAGWSCRMGQRITSEYCAGCGRPWISHWHAGFSWA